MGLPLRATVRKLVGPRLVGVIGELLNPTLQAPRDDGVERARLLQTAAQARVVRLHLGCGPRVLKGWLNVDLAFEPFEEYLQYYGDRFYAPEVRGERSDFFALDVAQGLPLPDESVAVIFHEDFIEHLSQRDTVVLLAETLRVLRPGGVHRVNTPNLGTSMRRSSEFARGAAGVHVDEWDQHAHLNVMTPAYLEELALMVGYERVEFGERDRSSAEGLPAEYRPDPRSRGADGNIFADLIKETEGIV